MKNFYYAVTETQNGKNYSFVLRVGANDNILSVLKGYPHLTTVNACKTKTEAERLVNFWNECYKNNGTYLFN